MSLKTKTVCLHAVMPEMHSFSMRHAKYFYDKPLPKYLDPKSVLIYRPHPVLKDIGDLCVGSCFISHPDCAGSQSGSSVRSWLQEVLYPYTVLTNRLGTKSLLYICALIFFEIFLLPLPMMLLRKIFFVANLNLHILTQYSSQFPSLSLVISPASDAGRRLPVDTV
jgi:hypothetical protein